MPYTFRTFLNCLNQYRELIKIVIHSRMNIFASLYLAALFVAFVPGVLITLPRGGKRMVVLAVHALLFTVVWYFTNEMVSDMTDGMGMTEGFQKMPRASMAPKQTRSTMEAKDTRSTMAAKAPR